MLSSLVLSLVLLFQPIQCLLINCRIVGLQRIIPVNILSATSFDQQILNSLRLKLNAEAELNVKCICESNLIGKQIQDGCLIDFMPSEQPVDVIQPVNSMQAYDQVSYISEVYGWGIFREFQSEFDYLKKTMTAMEGNMSEISRNLTAVNEHNAAMVMANADMSRDLTAVNEHNADMSRNLTATNELYAAMVMANADMSRNLTAVNELYAAMVMANAEVENLVHFKDAERDICLVIDGVYASILKELQTSKNYKRFRTLSSLLTAKNEFSDEEKRQLDEGIVAALSSLAKLDKKQAADYWRALFKVKRRRNFEQHPNFRCNAEQAKGALTTYLQYWRPEKKNVWPPESTARFEEIMEILIPIVFSPKSII